MPAQETGLGVQNGGTAGQGRRKAEKNWEGFYGGGGERLSGNGEPLGDDQESFLAGRRRSEASSATGIFFVTHQEVFLHERPCKTQLQLFVG